MAHVAASLQRCTVAPSDAMAEANRVQPYACVGSLCFRPPERGQALRGGAHCDGQVPQRGTWSPEYRSVQSTDRHRRVVGPVDAMRAARLSGADSCTPAHDRQSRARKRPLCGDARPAGRRLHAAKNKQRALEVVERAAQRLPQRDRDRRHATGGAGSLCGGARGAAARGGDGHAAGGGARRGARHAHDAQARPASAPRADGRIPCVRGRRFSPLRRLAPHAPRRARLPARPIDADALGACRGRRPGKHHHLLLALEAR
mmetsp:Transcript_1528/g.3292  ORF Transcript_1528/g.3292 Transcript_1528/m.3292 type:complete len:259 (+) Transcript_1528:452-1228(+)